jgi:xanthosine utilization system XapX-like protein
MSDKRFPMTPVIVGAVIALLGILVGLYFAQNAKEQLEAAARAVPSQEDSSETSSAQQDESALAAEMKTEESELPPLEPVVIDVGVPPIAEVPVAPVVESPASSAVPDTVSSVTPYEPMDEDDFVPVDPAEEEDSI